MTNRVKQMGIREQLEMLDDIESNIISKINRAVDYGKAYVEECGIESYDYWSKIPEWKYADSFETNSGESSLTVNWRETWGYGGYDAGSFEMPLSCLYDDGYETAVREHLYPFIREELERMETVRKSDLERKKRELARLKAELEG